MRDLNCQETRREIERYVDGECMKELTVELEAHLSDCEDCLDHVEFKRHVKYLVREKCGGDRLPEGLAERIRERIRSANPPP
jgi:mycothiol system anti-sigma-R factor